MHQFRMRPFKLFWGWTKNTSSSPAQGFFSPLFYPKIFPSYLPHLIYSSLHLQSSGKPPSLSSTKLQGNVNTRLEEGGELNIQGMWRGESKRNTSSQMHKREKKGKLLPFSTFFSFLWFFFSLCFSFCLMFEKNKMSGKNTWNERVEAWG